MFDSLPANRRDTTLTAVRHFFVDHAHELSAAASLLGGAAAEARILSCGFRLETADHIDSQIRRDLAALHRLLSLESVGDPDCIETELFSTINPASRQVERIWVLTEIIADLLRAIDDDIARRQAAARKVKGSLAA